MSDQKHATATAATPTETAPPPSELARLIQQPRRELDLMDNAQFGAALELAKQLSTATGFVPKHLLGNPGACLGVVTLAHAWRLSPFMLAAACAEVPPGSGKLCWAATAIQAGIERSGAIAGRLTFAAIGDWGKLAGKFVMRDGRRLDDNGQAKQYAAPAWNVADEEGLAIDVTGTPAGSDTPVTTRTYLKSCQPRNSTLWATDPQTQCRYRATRNWARLVTPHIMLGATAQDEYEPDAEPPPATAAATATPPAALAIVKPRKRAATPAQEAEQAARDAANAQPAATAPAAPIPVPFKLESALAAIDATGTPRGLVVAYLQARGKLPPAKGLDCLDQATIQAIAERPADLSKAVSEWDAERTLMSDIARQDQQPPQP